MHVRTVREVEVARHQADVALNKSSKLRLIEGLLKEAELRLNSPSDHESCLRPQALDLSGFYPTKATIVLWRFNVTTAWLLN